MNNKSIFISLSWFYFFYFSTIGVFIIFFPKVLQNLNYSTLEIGIIYSIMPLIRFITPFFFLKRFKLNQTSFNIAVIFSIISALSFYLTIDNFWLFLINNIFLGFSMSLTLPFVEAIAVQFLKDNYGKSRLFGSLGFMIIGMILAKFMEQNFLISLEFFLISIILTSFASFYISKYVIIKEEENSSSETFCISCHKYFWISLFLMQVAFGAFYNFFTIYSIDHGASFDVVSYLWAFGVICEVVMFIYQSPLLKKFELTSIIAFTILVTSFRWLVLFLFPDNQIMLYFSQSLHAFSYALYHTAVISYLFKIYSQKNLSQQFFYGISYGLGGFLGSIIAGKLYGDNLFLYASIITIFSFIFLKIPSKSKQGD